LHYIMASLDAFNAEIAVHLQAERITAGALKAKFVTSEGPITAPTASIAGDISSSNAPVEPSPGPRAPLPPPTQPLPPRVALYHEFGSQRDRLVLNHLGRYREGVRIVGDVQVDGAVLESSSATLKDDVEVLATMRQSEP
jgi:hypothetical protein